VILVDTSIWVDHFRIGDKALTELLTAGEVLVHAFVIGELALGRLPQRISTLTFLRALPEAAAADEHEALRFIERHALAGEGIGYIDVHLLAAARLTPGARLWTRDKRLLRVATRMGLASEGAPPSQ
jgi:predicted nucleic acid-binding protein